jgi:PEP-CTERM putative exosortase interaction domain
VQLRQYFLVLLTTPLLVSLTARSGWAFSFTLPSQQPSSPCTLSSFYCNPASYSNPNFGTVTTTIKSVSQLPLGGTNTFFNLLTSSVWKDNGWTFNKAQSNQNIQGYFEIGVYKPYAQPSTNGGVTVGADIQIVYHPVAGQDPMGSNVHWIQRVVSNHALVTYSNGVQELKPFGTNEDKIDVVEEQKDPNLKAQVGSQTIILGPNPIFTPYYDTVSPNANPIYFEDFSTRPNGQDNHDWYAELYLVQETTPKTVTIYNGISWGWNNTFTPSPPPISLPPLPCDGSSGGGGCVTTASDIAIRELPVSDFDSGDPNQLPEKVPEPTTILGLLALGAAGTIKIFKNKFNKQ